MSSYEMTTTPEIDAEWDEVSSGPEAPAALTVWELYSTERGVIATVGAKDQDQASELFESMGHSQPAPQTLDNTLLIRPLA